MLCRKRAANGAATVVPGRCEASCLVKVATFRIPLTVWEDPIFRQRMPYYMINLTEATLEIANRRDIGLTALVQPAL
jgi:hypothetical protein